ncbi:uncharacterized protein LOC141848886 [Brevipalpus obovatus]|uniref:uncharacterized protein LOC141848886 n=1 Tax=Brevipalpus obovatus TaxID=246614 RepID=UPI003D9E9060
MMEPIVLFSVLLFAVPAFGRFGPINIGEDSFVPQPNGPPPPHIPPPEMIPSRLGFARLFRRPPFRVPIVDYGNFRFHHQHRASAPQKVLLHNEILGTHHVVNGLRKDVLIRLIVSAIPPDPNDKLHPLVFQTKLYRSSEISIPTAMNTNNHNHNNNDHNSPPFLPVTTTTTTTTSTPMTFDTQTRENPVSEEPVSPSEMVRSKRSIDSSMGGGMGGGMVGGMGGGQDIRASFENLKNKFTRSYKEMEQIFKSTVDQIKKSFMPSGGAGMPSMPSGMPGMDSFSGMASGGMPSPGALPIPGADSMGKMPEMPGMGKK